MRTSVWEVLKLAFYLLKARRLRMDLRIGQILVNQSANIDIFYIENFKILERLKDAAR